MIFVEVSCEEWTKRYPDLIIHERSCPACGARIVTNIPFIERGYTGLTSKACSCGKYDGISAVRITTSNETHARWMSVIEDYL